MSQQCYTILAWNLYLHPDNIPGLYRFIFHLEARTFLFSRWMTSDFTVMVDFLWDALVLLSCRDWNKEPNVSGEYEDKASSRLA